MSLNDALVVISERLSEPTVDRIATELELDAGWLAERVRTSLFEASAAAKRIEHLLPEDGRILEVGAGLGLLSAALAMLGQDVVALEPAGPGFDSNRELSPTIRRETAVGYDLLPIPAEELRPEIHGHFDLAFSINVLEHVPDPTEALRRLDACLAPRAVMLHTCPNYRVPFEPHFGIPLLPIRPAATRRLLPSSIRDTGLWHSLNFVTARDVDELASRLLADVRFQPSELAYTLDRLATDEMFRGRHPRIARLAPGLERIGARAALGRLPPRWSTPMTFEWRHRDGRSEALGG